MGVEIKETVNIETEIPLLLIKNSLVLQPIQSLFSKFDG